MWVGEIINNNYKRCPINEYQSELNIRAEHDNK